MREEDLLWISANDLAQQIRHKEISPVEVVRIYLDQIQRLNPELNAYCTVAEEQAIAAAREAEECLMSEEDPPPLLGVPIAIKDLTPSKGIRTTYGSHIYADHVPDWDSVFCTRVKQAGAIILGKTNTPEFGHTGITDNLLFGKTNNPHDPSRTAGGSSGGSAAAVSAGMAPMAEGSDGGGSIRIPASFCGVYGLKPTFGRVPFDTGPTRFSTTTPFLHRGSLTRTVDDAVLLLNVVQGTHRDDPFSVPASRIRLPLQEPDLTGLKIAYSPNLDYFEIDPEVKTAVEKGLRVYERMGCQVDEVTLGLEEERVTGSFTKMWSVQFAAHYGHFLDGWRERMSKSMVSTIEYGNQFSAVEYKHWERDRDDAYKKVEALWETYDLLVTPTVAVPAFPHGPGPEAINGQPVNRYSGWMLTSLFNMTGHPAASVNCGESSEGLPIGMQIIGPRFAEELILQVSKVMEQTKGQVKTWMG
ncbi:MAG: amidase [Firmicutes bacterium]|nr:amidase [Bacillota bacterium]